MFSEFLFTHKYDIDDILAALCGSAPSWLETQTGTITLAEQTSIPTSHCFKIEPLPASYLQEFAMGTEQTHLSATEKAELQAILTTTTIQQLPSHFPNGRVGGWLRERVKDTALEWLDSNDLIPPSMRHINRAKAAKLYASRSVTIEDAD